MRQPHRRARRRKAARDQLLENDVIGLAHDARRAHDPARTFRHDRLRRAKSLSASSAIGAQALPSAGCASDLARLARPDAGRLQRIARQIEAAERGIFVEVAQDVGQLQRAAEMMRERQAGSRSMPNTRTESRPTAQATRSQ